MIHLVPIEFLLEICNPYECDPWGCGPITIDMVKDSLTGLMDYWDPDDDEQVWTAQDHADRIAYLVSIFHIDLCTWGPIQIDVGVPAAGYHNRAILDGHHRLAAAIYLGLEFVECEVQGQTSVVEEIGAVKL